MGVSSLFPLYGIVNGGMEWMARDGRGLKFYTYSKEEDHTEHIQSLEGLV